MVVWLAFVIEVDLRLVIWLVIYKSWFDEDVPLLYAFQSSLYILAIVKKQLAERNEGSKIFIRRTWKRNYKIGLAYEL